MKELIIKKGDKQITVADKEDVMDALDSKVSTDDPRLSDARIPTSHTHYLGDLKNTTSITGSDDLNNYTEQGRYTCSATNSQTVGNVPFRNIAFILEVILYNSTTPCQLIHTVAIDKNIQQSWYRVRNSNNVWSEWKQLGGITRIYQKINPYDESSDYNDLNRYTEQGTYICWNSADASKIGNTPSNIAFSLIVLPTAYNGVSSYYGCTQIVKGYTVSGDSSNKIWTRNYYKNVNGVETWTDWDCVSYEGHTHTKTDITTVTIPKNADLNDDAYWQVGIYTVGFTNGGTISNRPDYLTGNYAFELEVHGFGSTLLQILKTITANNDYERLFYRAKTNGGLTQWFRIANYDEIPLGHVITSGNIDTLTDDGVYGIPKTNISAGDITGVLPPTNRTGGVRSFLLESRKYDSNSSIQFAYMLTTTEGYNRIFYRARTSNEWDTWREIVQISDINTINTALDNKIETAGAGLSKDGKSLKHSNSVTALTSAALKKIKFDAQGHITGTANPDSVTCTVTYTDGSTSTINLVTR